jgi:hypothetical protein
MIEELIRKIVREEIENIEREDMIMTTNEVMERYRIKSKTTLNSYHKMGLPYFKGAPNMYSRNMLEQFFKQNMIKK